MASDFSIELHLRSCACRGGSWVVLGGVTGASCSASTPEREVVDLATWKSLGKPPCLEDYRDAMARNSVGERREFQRYHAEIPVRLSRIPSWKAPNPQAEDALTEVIARGGGMVRTRIAVTSGEIVMFEAGSYKSRAEVGYVAPVVDEEGSFLRIGLRFLDAPFPEDMIPLEAEPL